MTDQPRRISSLDLQQRLGCSRWAINRRLKQEPDFPRPYRFGNRYFWDEADIAAYEARSRLPSIEARA